MITIDNMHQGYIRVFSVVLIVLLVCLLYFIYLLEGEGAGGGVCAYYTLLLQLSHVCV